MKALALFITATLLWCHPSNSQIVTIPDPNFVNYLNNNGFSGAMSGNQLDTQHPSVQSTTAIDCSYLNIANLDGIQYFTNLSSLNCAGNPLVNLAALPPNLIELFCDHCSLTSLPAVLPTNLWRLQCESNSLTQLPTLPLTLFDLDCGTNNLSSLPTLPNSIGNLICEFNQLVSLPALPTSLTNLYCNHNQLATLPVFPSSLYTVHCNNNLLTTLPTLNSSLDQLNCNFNLLTTLPALPSSLTYLNCSVNPITSLPPLPSGMHGLVADSTLLTTFPTLPPDLELLHCENGVLTSLPPLPTGPFELNVANNQLTSLPDLPQNMLALIIDNNPNLVCLPRLTQISFFAFVNTGITCLPNYGDITTSNPLLTSLSLCDVFNTNGCDFYYNIAGQVYNDTNSNCINEPGEAALSNMKINLYQGTNLLQQVLTWQNGLYTIEVPFGTYDYSVDTAGMPFSVNCPASGFRTSVISAVDSTDIDMDFGLQCVPGFDVGVQTISGTHFVPGDTSVVRLIAGDLSQLYNMECASGIAGTVQIDFSGPVSYVGPEPGSLTPTPGINSLLYTIPDFGAVSPYTSFMFIMATDTLALLGDTVCFTVTVTPVSGDFVPANNLFTICDDVQNSFDPNDKQVYPSGEISQYQPWLTYTINFQNTGNAPAQHIVIIDTLDANLQEATFTFLDASHAVNTVVDGNIVRFTFPNINLPDSVNNEPDSHGFVQFKMKPVTTLQLGDSIQNTAAIYFDFNPPVITNTVINRVGQPVSVHELSDVLIKVFPNPANDELNLVTPFGSFDYELIDLLGRSVMQGQCTGTETKIGISNLQSGCYVLKVMKGTIQLIEKVNVY